MPNRILRESITTSESLELLSPGAERLFYRLLVKCDDFGRMEARPQVVLAACFPLKAGTLSPDVVEDWLTELEEATDSHGDALIRRYSAKGKIFLHMIKWADHNKLRAKKSKYPDPDGSASKCKQVQTSASRRQHMLTYPDSDSESDTDSESDSDIGEKPPRDLSPGQVLTNKVIELGLNGVNPPDYGKQCKVAKRMLEKRPLEYWLKAAEGMARLFPYSDGEPWDVLSLEKQGGRAAAAQAAPPSRGLKPPSTPLGKLLETTKNG